MTIRAVLFDFSGTLFRLEQDESWLAELMDHEGTPLEIEAQAELMRRMTAPVGQVVELDAEHVHAWQRRDLDPELHRKVYLEVLRSPASRTSTRPKHCTTGSSIPASGRRTRTPKPR